VVNDAGERFLGKTFLTRLFVFVGLILLIEVVEPMCACTRRAIRTNKPTIR
jgi:hypothetical protein